MPDTVKFSELDTATSVGGGDLAALAVEDQQATTGYTSKKATVNNIGLAINNSIEYATALQTTNKTVIGAINELNAGGGGGSSTLAGLEDVTLSTPAEGQALVYNGTKWSNGDVKQKIKATASGAVANFETSLELPLDELKAEIVAQQESGTPTPSNPLPITGVSSVGLTKCGKNFYPIKIGRDLFANNRGASHTTNDDILTITMDSQNNSGVYGGNTSTFNNQVCQTIKKFSGSFVLSLYAKASQNNSDVYFGFTSFYNTVATLSTNWQKVEVPMTLDSAIHTLNFYNRSGSAITVDVKDLQIEIGSTATAYEPYNAETKTIALGQTVYGGNVDCINGTATITHGFADLSTLNWTYSTNQNGWYTDDIKNNGLFQYNNVTWMSDIWNPHVWTGRAEGDMVCNSSKTLFCLTSDTVNTPTGVIVYELATQIEITGLTPANFTTFADQENNIFANSGDVEVEYFTSGASDTVDLIKTTTGIKRTVLHDTWVGFASGDTITLSDDADNYDELIIYASHLENNTYYAHRGIMRVDRESILWSISESAQSEEWRGLIDCIGSFQNNQVYSAFDFRFTDKRTIKSVSKTVGTWPFAQCGIEKIIGVKY